MMTTAAISNEVDLSNQTLEEICEYIINIHHTYLRENAPRVQVLLEKMARAYGSRNPKLLELKETFLALWADMENHMVKEEQVIFPFCSQLDIPNPDPFIYSGKAALSVSIEQPIAIIEHEHQLTGQLLTQIKELTDNFVPPEWACDTYRIMLQELKAVEQDIHRHLYKENHILFPKALKKAQELGQSISPAF